jgi:pilus assembly protein Flp/PilA
MRMILTHPCPHRIRLTKLSQQDKHPATPRINSIQYISHKLPKDLNQSNRHKNCQKVSGKGTTFFNLIKKEKIMNKAMQTVKNFWNNEEGVTAIEYGLLAALIAVGIIVGAQALGVSLNTLFNDIAGVTVCTNC